MIKIKPPVPKFDLNNIKIEQENQINKRKKENIINAIQEEFKKVPLSLINRDDIEKIVYQYVNTSVIQQLKKKKYNLIAQILIVHSIGYLGSINDFTQYYESLDKNEEILQILMHLQSILLINASYLLKFNVNKVCQHLRLSNRFQLIAMTVIDCLYQLNFKDVLQNYNELTAAVIKLAGDYLLYGYEGIQSETIIQLCGCDQDKFLSILQLIGQQRQQLLSLLIQKQIGNFY